MSTVFVGGSVPPRPAVENSPAVGAPDAIILTGVEEALGCQFGGSDVRRDWPVVVRKKSGAFNAQLVEIRIVSIDDSIL